MILTADQAEMLQDMGIDLDSLTEEEAVEILAEAQANFEESEESYHGQSHDWEQLADEGDMEALVNGL